MKFNNFAVIVVGPGFDPKVHRAVIKTAQVTYTTIGVDSEHKEQVIEALKGSVPVGGVFYGPEARKPLVDLGLVHTFEIRE